MAMKEHFRSSLSLLPSSTDVFLCLLTVLAPPISIAVNQYKRGRSDSLHLLLSTALCITIIFYALAVLHAIWVLYMRDRGGIWACTGAKFADKWRTVVNIAEDGVRCAVLKKNETMHSILLVSGTIQHYLTLYLRRAVIYLKEFFSRFRRVRAFIVYTEQRVPLLIDAIYTIYVILRDTVDKMHPSYEYFSHRVRKGGEWMMDQGGSSMRLRVRDEDEQTESVAQSPQEFDFGDDDLLLDEAFLVSEMEYLEVVDSTDWMQEEEKQYPLPSPDHYKLFFVPIEEDT